MMKGPRRMSMAVRAPSGEILRKTQEFTQISSRNKLAGLPVVRGVVNFVEMMILGVTTITDSAKMAGQDEEGEELSGGVLIFTVALALALGIGLFFLVPNLLTSLIRLAVKNSVLLNLIEGVIRIAIFVGYIAAISAMKDIRRVFMYHGAEHKTVYCYEADLPLTVENCRGFTTLHPRCGTSFLFIVMIVSILIFSLLSWDMAWWLRALLRLALLPVVAGVSYELLKLLARCDGPIARALRWPGMQLQRLTTRQPDDGMLQVAIAAMKACIGEEDDERIPVVEMGGKPAGTAAEPVRQGSEDPSPVAAVRRPGDGLERPMGAPAGAGAPGAGAAAAAAAGGASAPVCYGQRGVYGPALFD